MGSLDSLSDSDMSYDTTMTTLKRSIPGGEIALYFYDNHKCMMTEIKGDVTRHMKASYGIRKRDNDYRIYFTNIMILDKNYMIVGDCTNFRVKYRTEKGRFPIGDVVHREKFVFDKDPYYLSSNKEIRSVTYYG